jgi:hypothetical protein
MDENFKEIIWRQFGAAIDMLENAIIACPEKVWGNQNGFQEFWYIAFHALFWLDLYLSDSPDDFTPPAPFTLTELDPEGIFPERIYTKEELLNYLNHGRTKCKSKIEKLTNEISGRRFIFGSINLSIAELLIYNMRHVQHHAAQLNFILRQKIDSAPRWVRQTKKEINIK